MELINPDIIGKRMQTHQPRPLAAPLGIPQRAMARHCECGHCRACLDNARWERIFQEKFADPSYYMQRSVRQGSSLYGFECL